MDRERDPLDSVRVVVTANGAKEIKEAAIVLGLTDGEVLRRCLLDLVPKAAAQQRAIGKPITVVIKTCRIFSNVPSVPNT